MVAGRVAAACIVLSAGALAQDGNEAPRRQNRNRFGVTPEQPPCGDVSMDCEAEEGGSCQVRLAPPDQTAATYDVWWRQTQAWRQRREEQLAQRPYADRAAYDHPQLKWAQTNFVQPQVMVHDRYLYNRETNSWTVDRYLDDLLERYGGIDSVLLWVGYTNLGADERNAFDLFRKLPRYRWHLGCILLKMPAISLSTGNLPGGVAAVRQMVARFHARGVAVLWANFVSAAAPFASSFRGLKQRLHSRGTRGRGTRAALSTTP